MSAKEPQQRSVLSEVPWLLGLAYLFFLSIAMMGGGMKASFKHALKDYLDANAATFTELVSFVIGLLGTSLVQSSSTVTSMAVVLAQEGAVPLLIAIGIVHGANLGTSVTSSLVAFASESRPLTGNPFRDLYILLFEPRQPGFHRAVSTGVVHGMFNVILVTAIMMMLEIPFGIIGRASTLSAEAVSSVVAAGGGTLLAAFDWVSPATYTKPVVSAMLGAGMPGWVLVLLSILLLFACLKGFSVRMRGLMVGEGDDAETIGRRFLGTHPADTFLRGLVLTAVVQSSSATTSLVVPLAAMGFFKIRQIFPFIMGANIGTTVTALLAAASRVGQPGFEDGVIIALSHFYLNSLAVVLVAVVPGLYTSVMGATQFLADNAAKRPIWLLGYLAALSLGLPAIVYVLPHEAATGLMAALVIVSLVGPQLYLRTHPLTDEMKAQPPSPIQPQASQ